MSYPELSTCLMPNELSYVCKENIPIVTYVPNDECESTLIHPSTISIPHKVCEQRMKTLEQTYWIPLHLCNEWLFTAPTRELFTVLCGTEISVNFTNAWKIVFTSTIQRILFT